MAISSPHNSSVLVLEDKGDLTPSFGPMNIAPIDGEIVDTRFTWTSQLTGLTSKPKMVIKWRTIFNNYIFLRLVEDMIEVRNVYLQIMLTLFCLCFLVGLFMLFGLFILLVGLFVGCFPHAEQPTNKKEFTDKKLYLMLLYMFGIYIFKFAVDQYCLL